MSVNIQTSDGLLKIADNCKCTGGGIGTTQDLMITAQPVEILEDISVGDYHQMECVQVFSPDDITAQPVEDVTELYQFDEEV